MSKPPSKTSIVFSMLDRGAQIDVIARRVGWTLQQVRVMRSRWRKPTKYRRRPREIAQAESRARIEKRLAPVKALLDQGLSWGQVAARLGVTKNTIAGIVHRNPLSRRATEGRMKHHRRERAA